MNKTEFRITYPICVNTLTEFTMINSYTMNTKAHNNDLLLIIQHCQYFVHPSITTCKKFNETLFKRLWGKGRADQVTLYLQGQRPLFHHKLTVLAPMKGRGALRGLHRDMTVTKVEETEDYLKRKYCFEAEKAEKAQQQNYLQNYQLKNSGQLKTIQEINIKTLIPFCNLKMQIRLISK